MGSKRPRLKLPKNPMPEKPTAYAGKPCPDPAIPLPERPPVQWGAGSRSPIRPRRRPDGPAAKSAAYSHSGGLALLAP